MKLTHNIHSIYIVPHIKSIFANSFSKIKFAFSTSEDIFHHKTCSLAIFLFIYSRNSWTAAVCGEGIEMFLIKKTT